MSEQQTKAATTADKGEDAEAFAFRVAENQHTLRADLRLTYDFTDREDLKRAMHCVELCREIGNSAAMKPFVKREVMPSGLHGFALETFVRDGVVSYWH